MVNTSHPVIKKANKADLSCLLTAEQVVKGRLYSFQTVTSSELSQHIRDEIWRIFESNMQVLYHKSSFGWDPPSKRSELFHKLSRFLLIWSIPSGESTSQQLTLQGYSMFRFEREDRQNMIYCYELQIASQARRMGLGAALVHNLECIGRALVMEKLMLTIFRANTDAKQFYILNRFAIDDTSPDSSQGKEGGEEGQSICDYEMLSKLL
ncbi:acyl-CoA N-acyltransferase [Rickenella mellea]|uniref:N-alpha-acetyltransferase 40 n=1 Tax=Rickenella mellea TaxID=50990 RepID=A0A4Y7QN90_9AGAM|nr:acyl-CoA N-acyltransferase [Rickenella mellea]